jgi:hypothetical protein
MLFRNCSTVNLKRRSGHKSNSKKNYYFEKSKLFFRNNKKKKLERSSGFVCSGVDDALGGFPPPATIDPVQK